MFYKRLYKSGTNWCLWRWTDVQSEYIRRLHVVKTPWWAICIHFINKPDPEPFHHDHPVSFLSIVLKGGYVELRNGGFHTVRYWNYIKATPDDVHTIKWVEPKTVTLCFMGPKIREWGFHTDTGWKYWKDYYREKK